MSRELALEAKSRGNAAFSKGAYQEAISAFSEAIQHDPSDHVFFSNRSACYAGLSQFKEALDDAEKCVELAPKWVKGYSRKGLALFRLGKLDEALEVYQKGLELDPANEGLKTDIQSVQNELNRSKMPPNPFAQLFGPDIWMKIRLNPQLAPYLDDPDFVQKVNTLQQNPQAISSMLGDDKIKKLFGALIGMDFGDMSAAPEESQMEVENDDVPKDEDIGQVREASPEQKPMKEPVKEEKSPLTPEETEAEKEKLLGNDFYKKKQFSEAEAHYMKAHELAPNNPVYLTNLSGIF